MSALSSLHAAVDRHDRLVHADDLFTALNARAGGRHGALLAIPQVAVLVRLARRLRVAVTRTVTIADGELDLDCWVSAAPADEGVTVTVSLLRERPAWRARAGVAARCDIAAPEEADWTWEVDAELRVTRLSLAAAARHGLDPATVLARPLSRLVLLEPDATGAMPLLDAMSERHDFTDQPARLYGSGQRVTLAGHVRLDTAGGFGGFVGGTYPVAASAPAPLIRPFDHRLDGVLRGTLARIIADAEGINAGGEGPLDSHYADYAQDIANAGRHLLGLIDDLVDLEAIEREDFTTERVAVDLADVARRAAGLLSVRAGEAGVTIDRSACERPLPAYGEFRRMLQVVVNLVANAVRHSPRDGTVALALRREDGHALLTVGDAGRGIALADQARIFEKFERIDPVEPGGSGLGLYIARRLAQAMGGTLSVDSAPGEGARFTLSLPAA
ncbi:HAMP domain-containing sensor histidine kinase [Sphingomonas sp. BK235]|uniref:sensor histidine kinase n=1 Tax=Sphingomonas sp. BK235 TaxID=2512131 RepID=UPI001052B3E4|nr:HAMP domain-containing sensor histidine kinase [Sphingomonas sp. BK235]TCP32724.1 histidine kinase [Sphingomonas sp. BK235]